VNSQFCSVLLWLGAVALGQAPQAPLVEVQATSARYERLHLEALRFFRAVRQLDKPTLVRLTPAGDREAVRADLENPTSPLSRMLLTGSRAIRGRFMSVPVPRLTLLRQADTSAADDGIIVCFSDPRQVFRAPATVAALPAAGSNRAEICLPFVEADRHWFVVPVGSPP
jgi:hypothetical protein